MLLSDVFDKQSIKLNLESKTKEAAFKELVEVIGTVHPEFNRDTILSVIQEREEKLNTSVIPGVAVPHGYYPGTSDIFGALGISETGIEYQSVDDKPVHYIFLLVMGENARENHLRVLNRVMTLVNSEGLSLLQKASSPQEIYDILSQVS
jgi:mannitol/fructose-specific phosphotransferase system IIA component (Ntr-type)